MISIDEEARKRFESDWLSGHTLSIKDYLPSDQNETYIGTLEELVCIDLEFRWRQKPEDKSGSEATVPADEAMVPTLVEDYLLEFPELNSSEILRRLVEQEIYVRSRAGYVVEPSEYRSRFPSIRLDESIFRTGDGQETVAPAASLGTGVAEFPLQFGSYLLTSKLGRGGMGAVYRARQPAADREVAIKIANVSSMNPSTRQAICQRFETEARAAAALVHDHVVPIFDVGIIDEQPFYAMRLVEGGDLGDMSKAEPLEPRRAARYMLGISRGIGEAHREGMLHRDIKPQNVMIDESTDRAMICDFGLARFMEDDSGMTQAGQVLGTPSFMAPEQIKDSSNIDVRAEVYSLGGTLYQLLTGRPPFKAADVRGTLQQVLTEDPLPPSRLNSAIDRDLDTICMKCLEKEADARYQTADELADELDRFLKGIPLVARPAGPVKKVWKWSRRNKRLAASLSLACVAIFAGVSVYIYYSEQTRIALDEKSVALEQESIALGISQKNLASAIEVQADRDRRMMEDAVFASSPVIKSVRNEFLRESLAYYDRLISDNRHETSMRTEVAIAMSALGTTSLELKEPRESCEKHLQDAIDLIRALPEQDQKVAKVLQAHSDALIGLGVIARERDDLPLASKRFSQAAELREQWVEVAPNDLEAKRKLANAMMNGAVVLLKQDRQFDSELQQIEAQQIRVDLVKAGKTSRRLKRDMAQAEFNLAMLELHLGNKPQVIQRLRKAREMFGELAHEAQTDTQLWQYYADARLREAHFFAGHPNDPESDRLQASTMINEALSDISALYRLSSGQSKYQLVLMGLYQYGIDTLFSQNNMALVEPHVTEFSSMKLAFVESLANAGKSLENDKDFITMLLHAKRQKALLAVGTNAEGAIRQVESALDLFDEHEEVVSGDPLLADDYQRLSNLLGILTGAAQ